MHLVLQDQSKVLNKKSHNNDCMPNQTQNVIDQSINKICEEAAEGNQCAPKVYKKGLKTLRTAGLDLASSNPIPTFQNKKASIYRKRNKKADVNKICARSLDEVEVPADYRNFLKADYYDGEIRILVFCSDEGMRHMKAVEHFFMDGTFKSCPFPFTQLFSIHGDLGSDSTKNNVLPLLYAFMSHKSAKAYTILWDLIKVQIPDWDPKKVNVDFEEATISSLLAYHEGVVINGCHYHFTNALWRKAKAFKIKIKGNKRNKRIISMCGNLAHLPLEQINDGWNYILTQIPKGDTKLEKFEKYFESFWMKPRLQKLWCVYGERHRTTNLVEGWHHGINKEVLKNETNILMALKLLYDDAVLSAFYGDQIKTHDGQPRHKRQKTSMENDDFIRETQMELLSGDINISQFLDKIR